MRAHVSARLVLGVLMMTVACGLLVMGGRVFLHRGDVLDRAALDGVVVVNPVDYVVPWAMAVMMVLAAYHVLHGRTRDEVF